MATPIKNMFGEKIGALTPIKLEKIDGKSKWLCRCDCGNYYYRKGTELRYMQKHNGFPTCGCGKTFYKGTMRTLTGIKTSLIEVVSYDKQKNLYLCINRKGVPEWLNAESIRLRIYNSENHDKINKIQNDYALKYGYSSIKDYNKDSIQLHHILFLIKSRCYDKQNDKYIYYGGKGIKVYNKWLENSKEFVHWAMLNGFRKGLQIDRINNNGNYEPSNCRWVSRIQNMNNRSNNFYITIDNETKSLASWCREYNLDYKKTHTLVRYKNKSLESIIKGE